MQNIDVSAIFNYLSVSGQKLNVKEIDIFPRGRSVLSSTIAF